jgi:hypothetical protein
MKSDFEKPLKFLNINLKELNIVKENIAKQLKKISQLCKTWDNNKTNKLNSELNSFDLEKFVIVGKYFKKLIDIIEFTASINQYKAT